MYKADSKAVKRSKNMAHWHSSHLPTDETDAVH